MAVAENHLAEGFLPKRHDITAVLSNAAQPSATPTRLEKAVQHSLRAACTHFEADNANGQEVRVHMIDTPDTPISSVRPWVPSTRLKPPLS